MFRICILTVTLGMFVEYMGRGLLFSSDYWHSMLYCMALDFICFVVQSRTILLCVALLEAD